MVRDFNSGHYVVVGRNQILDVVSAEGMCSREI